MQLTSGYFHVRAGQDFESLGNQRPLDGLKSDQQMQVPRLDVVHVTSVL